MSKRNAQVIALAGAAALAGFGYALAHRSGTRARTHSRRRGERAAPDPVQSAPRAAQKPAAPPPAPFQDADRISSSPDALDVALDLEGVFDGDSARGIEITARPHEHVPALQTADDEEAPAPEDLGLAWLKLATESERSLGTADTLPDIERLERASEELGEMYDDDEQDETTAEYVRLHRISSAG